jgi:hypothetical protein
MRSRFQREDPTILPRIGREWRRDDRGGRTMGYLFDPVTLHEISKKGVGLPFDGMVSVVSDELSRAYPGHIETTPNWIFSLAGGATGIMTILHASLSEYIIIFGTPVGTEGFSGRYHIDIYDYVMAGEMRTYTERDLGEPRVSGPGEWQVLHRGQVKGFKLPEAVWLLEYGRGPIFTALPMALGDAVFSGMDATTIVRTLWNYGKLAARELFRGKI